LWQQVVISCETIILLDSPTYIFVIIFFGVLGWQNVLFYFLRNVQFIVFTLNFTLALSFSFAFAFLAILVELMNIAE